MQISPCLRAVLKLDGASCLAIAAVALSFSTLLSQHSGIPLWLLSGAAALLVPIGLFILWLGSRSSAPTAMIGLVIAGNIGWVAASLFVAFTLPTITGLGQLAVAIQGLAVLGMALLEWAGVCASRRFSTESA